MQLVLNNKFNSGSFKLWLSWCSVMNLCHLYTEDSNFQRRWEICFIRELAGKLWKIFLVRCTWLCYTQCAGDTDLDLTFEKHLWQPGLMVAPSLLSNPQKASLQTRTCALGFCDFEFMAPSFKPWKAFHLIFVMKPLTKISYEAFD